MSPPPLQARVVTQRSVRCYHPRARGPPRAAEGRPSSSSPTARAPMPILPLRVIFLDVDGVLCCNQNGQLEPDKMQQLVRITKEAGAKVCISSNWRLYEDLREHLYAKLSAAGIDCIGTTPDAGEATHGECMRPCEIGAWIKNWHQDKGRQRITSFVAVDDRSLLHEKGGSILRGAPPPSGIGTPPPPPPAPIASMGTPSTCRRRDTHVDRPFRTDQCGARLDEVRCHAHDRPAARETRPDLRISRKPPLRDTRACRCDQIRPAPQSSERGCRFLEKAGPVHLRDERAQPSVRFTLSVAIPMSMCLHMHTCTAHTTRIKSFVQIVTADAIVQNVTAVEGAEIQSFSPPPKLASINFASVDEWDEWVVLNGAHTQIFGRQHKRRHRGSSV